MAHGLPGARRFSISGSRAPSIGKHWRGPSFRRTVDL
jgi:hypothetical protein